MDFLKSSSKLSIGWIAQQEEVAHTTGRESSWVQDMYDESMYKVWKMRYVLSEGLRYVRTNLPTDLELTRKLHEWEDAVAGPVE